MARRFDGRAVARQIYEDLAIRIEKLRQRGVVPCLTAVLVGDDPSSHLYVENKKKACEAIGLRSQVLHLPEDTPEATLLEHIHRLNDDPDTHGILVQLPLPDHIRKERVIEAIHPDKDVDGFHPVNKGKLLEGRAKLIPCTPGGILKLLDTYGIQVEGKHAVVIGRSDIVGKPMALLFLHRHATITVCHSRTKDLERHVRSADILVTAIGRPATIPTEWIEDNMILIDVGINPVSDEDLLKKVLPEDHPRWKAFKERGRLILGDIHPMAYERSAGYTPVPGGVGPLTVAMVVHNTVLAAEIQTHEDV